MFRKMAWCKTVVTSLLTYWSYYSLGLSHRFNFVQKCVNIDRWWRHSSFLAFIRVTQWNNGMCCVSFCRFNGGRLTGASKSIQKNQNCKWVLGFFLNQIRYLLYNSTTIHTLSLICNDFWTPIETHVWTSCVVVKNPIHFSAISPSNT